ncbi:MAG: hypothetical protein OSA97_10550 [Nevskia sp.]|nr:hypothetical protein [Nevskia sp.]
MSVLDAVHTAAGSLEDQVRVMLPPTLTEAGLAEMVTVGPLAAPLLPEEPLPEEAPEDAPDEAPEEAPDEAPEEAPDEAPEEAPDDAPEEEAPEAPDEAPDAPEDVPPLLLPSPPLAEQPASASPAVISNAAAPRDKIPKQIVLFMLVSPEDDC